jgi:hypothetical protein
MITVDPLDARAPADGRALVVLRVLVDTDEWNEHNYLMQAATPSSPDRGGDGSLRANA